MFTYSAGWGVRRVRCWTSTEILNASACVANTARHGAPCARYGQRLKSTPRTMVPEQQFLADFPEEAAVLIAALKRVLTQGLRVTSCNVVGRPFLSDQSNSEQLVGLK